MFDLAKPTPLQLLADPNWQQKGVQVYIKREDLIDLNISGNKWRKLKYNFVAAKEAGHHTILTFGGAYSNHIAATAAAARRYGFQSIGIIRGEELHPQCNPTLAKAHQDGMQLIFVTREAYKNRNEQNWINELKAQYDAYIIPEGGSNGLAVQGVSEVIPEINIPFEYIICPVGTGGTLAGLANGLMPHQYAIGIAALNGKEYLEKEVKCLIGTPANNWSIDDAFTFEGYAKYDQKLIDFIQNFYDQHQVVLDPIYTGKMMFGLNELIKSDKFQKGATIVAIHTGGLQGIGGFNIKNGTSLRRE